MNDNNKVTLSINGRGITVPSGSTILQVAKANDIRIPTLCYDPRLKPYGSCRLCLVEVNGARNPMLSCATEALDGMEVNTNSLTLFEIRRTIVELLLSDHPYDCLLCEKSGNCALQNLAYELQIEKIPFEGIKHEYTVTDFNPLIERDYQKCVLCGKCVRICREVQGWGCYDFANRGFDTIVTTPFDRSLTDLPCEFCGQCISTCPVGALTERQSKFKGRIWETKKVSTVCPYCGVGCQLDLRVKDGDIVRVSSKVSEPGGFDSVNSGNLCVKGRFGFDFVTHPDRLTKPLIKKGKGFKEVSWDEALETVTGRISTILQSNGSDAIAGLSSAKVTNEENYLFQKMMRAAIGTNNVDHCARLCHASTVAGLAKAFGSGAMTNSISDIPMADCIVVIGSNTTESHPIISLEIKKAVNEGCKLIVIDPRKIELVDYSMLWLRQRPGTDVALLNGIMKVIVDEKSYDKKFIKAKTEGFESFLESIARTDLSEVEEITSVPIAKIKEAARIFANAEAACVIYSMGITQHTSGTDNVLAIANLAMLTGNIGRPGTGVNPLRGQNNVQGACDMGALPGLLPGYQRVDDDLIRERFSEAWGVKGLPKKPGLTLLEMLDGACQGKIKAMYIMGENPMLSDPDINHVEKALKGLELLVVQDIFLTETAKLADVVLPAASFAEKEGTFTNTERRVQRVRKAVDSPGQSRQDWEIIRDISGRLGYSMNYSSTGDIFMEMAGLTPQYAGMNYARLDEGGLQWPCPASDHPGTPILHVEKFTGGKGSFHDVRYRPATEEPDGNFPFLLTTGRIRWHFHTGSMTRRSRGLSEICSRAFIEINPDDAKCLKVKDGDTVTVASKRGRLDVEACVTPRCDRGVTFMPFHFVEAAANLLTNPALDPEAKIPELKVCAVKIAKKRQKSG